MKSTKEKQPWENDRRADNCTVRFVYAFYVCGLIFSGLFSSISSAYGATPYTTELKLGGGLRLLIDSDRPVDTTEETSIRFASHLPGFSQETSHTHFGKKLVIKAAAPGQPSSLHKRSNAIEITVPWHEQLPDDLLHLLYGISRVEWIKQKIYPVHSACIGSDQNGYSLLVGVSGAGKTSMTLHSVLHHDKQIYSTDKTLVRFEGKTGLIAIAGTPSLTVRKEDEWRWTIPEEPEEPEDPENQHFFRHWERKAFYLPEKYYSKQQFVPIKGIYIIHLTSEEGRYKQLSPLSALHILYPFFLDRQREDIIIGSADTLWDGAVSKKQRLTLAKQLNALLTTLPAYQVSGSPEYIYQFIEQTTGNTSSQNPVQKPLACQPKTIVYGVCGLGSGHSNRAASVIRYLMAQGHRVLVTTYGDGLTFFQQHKTEFPDITIIPVANPYYPGIESGLDFRASANYPKNQISFHRINSLAMDQLNHLIGTPDLVLSDYELVSARYAYAKQAPLVTLDHESIYWAGDFQKNLNGYGYIDEIERLNLFFPAVKKRLMTSFFTVPFRLGINTQEVSVVAPIIRPNIIKAKGSPKSPEPSLLVYISNQKTDREAIPDWINLISKNLPAAFNASIFLPADYPLPDNTRRLTFYRNGNPKFDVLLITSHGIISTAGHTLLSEAMYLQKPVYALPLSLYEQQHNASQIKEGEFGLMAQELTADGLNTFLSHLDKYESNIKQDQKQILNFSSSSVFAELDQLLGHCLSGNAFE